jgi:hypothetical protein
VTTSNGLSIGEFATLSHLSVGTLRRYHQAGLLEPTTVDPFAGYRHYRPDRIGTAQVIHRLREFDVPLAARGHARLVRHGIERAGRSVRVRPAHRAPGGLRPALTAARRDEPPTLAT